MNPSESDIPFKPGLAAAGIPMRDGIWQCLDASQVQGSNARYMRMYDRLARWYDLGERWIGRLLWPLHRPHAPRADGQPALEIGRAHV